MSSGLLPALKLQPFVRSLGHVLAPQSSLSFFVASPLPSLPWHSTQASANILLPRSMLSLETATLPEVSIEGFSGFSSSARDFIYAASELTSSFERRSPQPGIEVPLMPYQPDIFLWALSPAIILTKSSSDGVYSSKGVDFHL